jgi:RHS repeat-associated protein
VRDVVDDSGRLRLHREFDAFGQITEETHYDTDGLEVGPPASQYGYVDVAFAFTGRLFDRATGLQNNLNRWYDPSVGRWMSEDPIGFESGDANLYRYVGNAPTADTDPSGLVEGPPYDTGGYPMPEPPGGPHPDIPGGPWRWCPNPQNPRGGVYVPKGHEGPNPPSISWDPYPGHWDRDDGTGTRERYSGDGKLLPPGEHGPQINCEGAAAAGAIGLGGIIGFWIGSGLPILTPWPDPY